LKLTSTAVEIWARYVGTTEIEELMDIDANDDAAFVVGVSDNSAIVNGVKDVFVLRLDATTGEKEFAVMIGGDQVDEATSITLDTTGVYISGDSSSAGYSTSP